MIVPSPPLRLKAAADAELRPRRIRSVQVGPQRRIRSVLDQPQPEQRSRNAEHNIILCHLPRKIRLLQHAPFRIFAAGNRIQAMHLAIKRTICRPIRLAHEPSHPHRPAGGDERRNRVGGSIQRGQSHLRIRMRLLGVGRPRAASSRRRLRMTHRATVPVKRRSQPLAFFNRPRNRNLLPEPKKSMAEQRQFVRSKREIRPTRSGRALAWAGVLLSPRAGQSDPEAEKQSNAARGPSVHSKSPECAAGRAEGGSIRQATALGIGGRSRI